jgi:hypothetical protein
LEVALLQGLNPSSSGIGRVTTLTLTHFIATYLAEYRQPLFYLNLGEPILLTYHAASQPDRESSSPRPRSSCPYPGLRPFQVEESSYFFGRRDLTAKLLNKVRLSRFVALVGNSGTGKSSVLKAGLIHALRTGSSISGSDRWTVRVVQPGEKPLNSLVLALLNPDLSTSERSRQLNQIQPLVHQGANGFRKILEVNRRSIRGDVHPLPKRLRTRNFFRLSARSHYPRNTSIRGFLSLSLAIRESGRVAFLLCFIPAS